MRTIISARRVRGILLALVASACLSLAASATPLVAGGDHTGESHRNEIHAFEVLDNIILASANLRGTDFTRTSFVDAIFTNAQLRDASFQSANLARAILTGANLRNTSFFGANLIGADLSGVAQANRAIWTGATYSLSTILPAGLDPVAEGMILVPEAQKMLLVAMISLGLFAASPRRRAALARGRS